jgi:DNA-binding transcriptional LysR family regulator
VEAAALEIYGNRLHAPAALQPGLFIFCSIVSLDNFFNRRHETMDHSRLKTFRIVSEMLSFRKAARELHLTQPAITAQIKALEESLGVALFSRVRRSITLTTAGETLLIYARKIEELSNQATAALRSFGAQEEIEIGVGASYTLAVYLLPKLLPTLLKSWPKLRIHIVAGSTSEILQAVTTRRVNLGIIEAPAFRPDLKIELFGHDELTLIVPADHPWTQRQSITPAELIEEPILLREPGSGMRRFVEEFLERNGVHLDFRTAVDMNSTEAIVTAVEAGVGVGFVPYLALKKSLIVKSVKIIAVECGPVLRPLSLVLHEGPEPQGPILQLANLLRHSLILRPCDIAPDPNANYVKDTRRQETAV